MTPAQVERQRANDRIINMTPAQIEVQRTADRNRRQQVFIYFYVFTFMSILMNVYVAIVLIELCASTADVGL
jgi:hypothetical protein